MKLTIAIILIFASTASSEDSNQTESTIAIEPRVVGGRKAPLGKYPFFAAVYRKDGYYCGGTIIAKRWILTAAHCFNKTSPSDVLVQVGTIRRKDPLRDMLKVERIISHEQFNETAGLYPELKGNKLQNPNDIALLLLKQDLAYSTYVRPVDISGAALDLTSSSKYTGIGFGRVNATKIPMWLQEIELNAVPLPDCQKRWKGVSNLDHTKICTYGGSGHGMCKGDSGGPLLYGERQIGVMSATTTHKITKACEQILPDVFTRVAAYTAWINKNTNGAVAQSGHNPDSMTAPLGRYPFYAGIIYSKAGFVCGGSIIAGNYIMTAAHCFEANVDPSKIWAQVGTVRRSDPKMRMYQAQAIIIHEGFKKNVKTSFLIRPNDIALIRLVQSIVYSPHAMAVDLTAGPMPKGLIYKATALGFKRVENPTPTDAMWLQAVQVDVKKFAECLNLWGQRAVNSMKICAFPSVGQGICIGDTGGGPLVYGKRQIGIMSMIDFKDKTGCWKIRPDLYTRVETHLKWIKKNTRGQVMGLGRIADDDGSSASFTLPKISLTIVLALINLL